MSSEVGTIDYVDPRQQWKDEAHDFTPWLAQEGLSLLGEATGLGELEVVRTEAETGPFRADIVARVSEEEDHIVVIENQLDKTDHDHLGKLITYAAGLAARSIVWIATAFTEDHRRAIEWLNEKAGESVSYYALEIMLLRINGSPVAPQFNVVASPNVWARTMREPFSEGELTETRLTQLEFWQELKGYCESSHSSLRFRKPRPSSEYRLAIGSSRFSLKFRLNLAKRQVASQIYIRGPQAKRAFDDLRRDKEAIEEEIGSKLDWNRREEGQDCWIALLRDGSISESHQREALKQWFKETGERFQAVFSPRIQSLKLEAEAR